MPTRLSSIERQQKKTQYPGWHQDTLKKRLWIGKGDEVPLGDKDVWGNIEIEEGWRDQQASSSVL